MTASERTRLVDWAWHVPHLLMFERLVIIFLACEADNDLKVARNLREIAARCEQTTEQVETALRTLEKRKVAKVERAFGVTARGVLRLVREDT